MRNKWLLILLTGLLLPVCALAEIRAEAVFTPSDLVMPQEVTLSVTGTNDGAQDIKLCDMDGNVLCDMADASVLSYNAPYAVTQEELDAGSVSLLLRYSVNGTSRSTKLKAAVRRMEAAADLAVTRSADTQNGQTVLLYRVHNTGNVALRDITVRDPLCGAQAQLESLDAGEKATLRVVVPAQEDGVSQPSVTAVSVYDGKTLRRDLAPLKLTQKGSAVTAEAVCVYGKNGVSRLRVDVTNTGEDAVSGICVTEESLGVIGSLAGNLESGEKITFSREMPEQDTREYALTVTNGAGETLYETQFVSVCAGETRDGIDFTIAAQAHRSRGEVTAVITMNNLCETTLRDVTLSEAYAGELRTLSALPTGETVFTVTYPSERDSAQFFAAVTEEDGTRRMALSPTVSVENAADVETDTGTLPKKGAVSALCEENVAYPRMLASLLAVLAILLLLFGRKAVQKENENQKIRDRNLKNLRRTRRSEQAELDPKEITKEHRIVKASSDADEDKKT